MSASDRKSHSLSSESQENSFQRDELSKLEEEIAQLERAIAAALNDEDHKKQGLAPVPQIVIIKNQQKLGELEKQKITLLSTMRSSSSSSSPETKESKQPLQEPKVSVTSGGSLGDEKRVGDPAPTSTSSTTTTTTTTTTTGFVPRDLPPQDAIISLEAQLRDAEIKLKQEESLLDEKLGKRNVRNTKELIETYDVCLKVLDKEKKELNEKQKTADPAEEKTIKDRLSAINEEEEQLKKLKNEKQNILEPPTVKALKTQISELQRELGIRRAQSQSTREHKATILAATSQPQSVGPTPIVGPASAGSGIPEAKSDPVPQPQSYRPAAITGAAALASTGLIGTGIGFGIAKASLIITLCAAIPVAGWCILLAGIVAASIALTASMAGVVYAGDKAYDIWKHNQEATLFNKGRSKGDGASAGPKVPPRYTPPR